MNKKETITLTLPREVFDRGNFQQELTELFAKYNIDSCFEFEKENKNAR